MTNIKKKIIKTTLVSHKIASCCQINHIQCKCFSVNTLHVCFGNEGYSRISLHIATTFNVFNHEPRKEAVAPKLFAHLVVYLSSYVFCVSTVT